MNVYDNNCLNTTIKMFCYLMLNYRKKMAEKFKRTLSTNTIYKNKYKKEFTNKRRNNIIK